MYMYENAINVSKKKSRRGHGCFSTVSGVCCQDYYSSRGVLLPVMRRYVWFRNLKNEEAMGRVGPQRYRKKRRKSNQSIVVCTFTINLKECINRKYMNTVSFATVPIIPVRISPVLFIELQYQVLRANSFATHKRTRTDMHTHTYTSCKFLSSLYALLHYNCLLVYCML